MNKFETLFNYMINCKYLTAKDILYGKKYSFNLSSHEYKDFLKFKMSNINIEQNKVFILPLIDFNANKLFYSNSLELNSYINLSFNEYFLCDTSRINMKLLKEDDNFKNLIFSEIMCNLSIEGVRTDAKRINNFFEGNLKLETKTDKMIINHLNAFNFILKKPEFNKENLLKLYKILTKGCLESNQEIEENKFYRNDEVEIDGYLGCPYVDIERCMNSLFDFINIELNTRASTYKLLLPHICHYYISYIHPYFDYNGRTARMVSFWISLLANSLMVPVLSEAIDDTKNKYYQALRNTRDSNNDLTYFLIYIFKILVNQTNCYKNVEYADTILKNKNIVLTENEKVHLKKIMVNSKGKFTYKDFASWIKNDITKQGAFKILNEFTDYGLLNASEAKSKVKLFEINIDMLPYRPETL